MRQGVIVMVANFSQKLRGKKVVANVAGIVQKFSRWSPSFGIGFANFTVLYYLKFAIHATYNAYSFIGRFFLHDFIA
jgi:hypothetical protein